jgi:hypothetical protein
MHQPMRLGAEAQKKARPVSVHRRSDELQLQESSGPSVARWSIPNGRVSASQVLQLQRQVGNQAVGHLFNAGEMVQRQFEDEDKIGEDGLEMVVPEESVGGAPKPERINEFGEIDGGIASDVQPHAVTDLGRTGESSWHHASGSGGKGNQSTGDAQLVAPVYKTKPAKPGGQAKAWIKRGTATVKVKRSYIGVTHGDQGAYKHSPGNLWMSPRARDRVDKHEEKHVKKTKEIHEKHIKPLEDRINKYQGLIKAKKAGATAAAAETALKTEIDWTKAVTDFATEDTAENQPMGPVDTDDMAKGDFYALYNTSAKFKKKTTNALYLGMKGQASKKGKT